MRIYLVHDSKIPYSLVTVYRNDKNGLGCCSSLCFVAFFGGSVKKKTYF